jgi:hypothetical protein
LTLEIQRVVRLMAIGALAVNTAFGGPQSIGAGGPPTQSALGTAAAYLQ